MKNSIAGNYIRIADAASGWEIYNFKINDKSEIINHINKLSGNSNMIAWRGVITEEQVKSREEWMERAGYYNDVTSYDIFGDSVPFSSDSIIDDDHYDNVSSFIDAIFNS